MNIITLSDKEREFLQRKISAATTEQRFVFRARIILLTADGVSITGIANQLNTVRCTVTKWRRRFREKGIDGLYDASRPGYPRKYTEQTEKRIRDTLNESPPRGYSQWNGRLLAERLNLSKDYVWRVLRKHNIQLQRRRSWCESTDPEFAEKAVDVVGLYLNPPENAVVLCRREAPYPGSGTSSGISFVSGRQNAFRVQS